MSTPKVTKADLEQELIDLRSEIDSPLMRARERMQKRILEDVDWWYEMAKSIAEHGSSREDQVRQVMIKTILDKVMPDRKEITRGGARIKAGRVIFNNNAPPSSAPAVPIDVTPGDDDE